MHDPREDISAYLDGELEGEALRAFEEALAANADLRAEVEALGEVDGLYRAENAAIPEGFTDDVFTAIKDEQHVPDNVHAFPLRRILAAAASIAIVVGIYAYVSPGRETAMQYELAQEMAPASPALERMNAPAEDTADVLEEQESAPVEIGLRMRSLPSDEAAPAQSVANRVENSDEDKDLYESLDEQVAADMPALAATPAPAPAREPASPAPPPPAAERPEILAEASAVEMAQAAPPDVERELLADAGDGVAMEGAGQRQVGRTAAGFSERRADANMAKKAEAKEADSAQRTIGSRRFELRDGLWTEEGYDGQDTKDLPREDTALSDVIDDAALRREFMLLAHGVVFRVGSVWYRLAPPAQ